MKWHRAPTEDPASDAGTSPSVGLDLMSAPPESPSATAPIAQPFTDVATGRGDLDDALAAFRDDHPPGVYSARRTIDALLDVWALAAAVDRTAAHPIEAELVALVERETVTARELSDCIALVETALEPLTR